MQGSQVNEPVSAVNCPALQPSQLVAAIWSASNLPAGHRAHTAEFAGAKLPAEHWVHSVAFVADAVPAGQVAHVPWSVRALPEGQAAILIGAQHDVCAFAPSGTAAANCSSIGTNPDEHVPAHIAQLFSQHVVLLRYSASLVKITWLRKAARCAARVSGGVHWLSTLAHANSAGRDSGLQHQNRKFMSQPWERLPVSVRTTAVISPDDAFCEMVNSSSHGSCPTSACRHPAKFPQLALLTTGGQM